nr:immunoglobulin heavy chain junction region [Mus musculus]
CARDGYSYWYFDVW